MFNKRSNFRDCKAWKDEGLSLRTNSNECCKLYDAAISQYVGWYDDESFGGLEKTIGTMLSTDPDFVMGKALSIGLDLMGTGRTIRLDSEFLTELNELEKLTQQQNDQLSVREKQHIEAVRLFAKGQMSSAALVWEDILVDHPTDMLAIKFSHDAYFYLGKQAQMRDSIARVLPSWKKSAPLYSYLHGMYSFGLIETNFYDLAEYHGRLALDLNCNDAWATHAMAHYYEMKGLQDDGISFLSRTLTDWQSCQMLSCHNFWHWALYHIEKEEYEAALDLFDERISKIMAENQGALLDIVDGASLLFRLQLEGQDPGKERWNRLHNITVPRVEDHIVLFNDAHLLMSYLGSNDNDSVNKFMQSLRNYVACDEEETAKLNKQFGLNLMDGLISYKEGRFSECVDKLMPIRYDIVKGGGSNAQRDVFNQVLVHAAMKSSNQSHSKLSQNLLSERKYMKEKSPLTDRLIAKAMGKHQA